MNKSFQKRFVEGLNSAVENREYDPAKSFHLPPHVSREIDRLNRELDSLGSPFCVQINAKLGKSREKPRGKHKHAK